MILVLWSKLSVNYVQWAIVDGLWVIPHQYVHCYYYLTDAALSKCCLYRRYFIAVCVLCSRHLQNFGMPHPNRSYCLHCIDILTCCVESHGCCSKVKWQYLIRMEGYYQLSTYCQRVCSLFQPRSFELFGVCHPWQLQATFLCAYSKLYTPRNEAL